MIRSLEQLRQDQAAIFDAYRRERAAGDAVAALPRPGTASPIGVFGRVDEVITSDATYGPHLLVVRQVWSDTPPEPSDGSSPAVRCYPTPNNTVTDYSVDDYVRITPTHGAMLAERLA